MMSLGLGVGSGIIGMAVDGWFVDPPFAPSPELSRIPAWTATLFRLMMERRVVDGKGRRCKQKRTNGKGSQMRRRERLSKAFVGIVGTAEPRRLQFTKQKATKN
jgi:hypothetical protein